jgi:putative hydrolase of the HAD superfamily
MAMGGQSTETLRREYYSTLLPEAGVAADAFVPALELLVELAEAEMLWRVAGRGAATALDQLRGRGITVGVVSNSDGRVAWGCERAGLAGHLDFIIDSHYVGVEKPDPRIFSLGLERAAVAAEDAAYVGDLYSVDVLGSRQAGLTAVLYDPFDLNPGADCVRIRHLIDLLELVDHH